MIKGVSSSQNYVYGLQRNDAVSVKSNDSLESSTSSNVREHDSRANALAFIESASPEELAKKVDSLKGRMPSVAMFNLNEILNSSNGEDVMARISRLQGKLENELRAVLAQEQEIINEGRASGKTDKDILLDIFKMQDEQSDLYKMGARWGDKGLSAPENYQKLRRVDLS
jgi:DNA-directed RNA polymerase subunit F